MKIRLLLLSLLIANILSAQNSQKIQTSSGEITMLTLSGGRYDEFHEYQDYERVGSAIIDMRTKKIVALVDRDTIRDKAFYEIENNTRFFCMDNYTEKYIELTPYHYAANNPIFFVDVNGDSISVSNLIANQNGKLNIDGLYILFNMMSDLQDITGQGLQVNSNGMLVTDGKAANGGSAKARNYLNGLIGSNGTINVGNDPNKSTQGGGIGYVNMNSSQIEDNIATARAAGINEKSFGFGMSFLHESTHTATGTFVLNPNATQAFKDPLPTNPNAIGGTVIKVNEFRTELGWETRQQYFWHKNPSTGIMTMTWKKSNGTNVSLVKTNMSRADRAANRQRILMPFINTISNL